MAVTRTVEKPVYGQYGVLTSNGRKVQCHICGRWYKGLGNHVWRSHGMPADEYREEFGLKYTHGLIGDGTRQLMSQNQKRRWELYGPLFEPDVGMTPEKLAKVRGRPLREEALQINKATMEKRRAPLLTIACVECGKPISIPEYRLRAKRHRTCCSPKCRRAYLSRITTGRKHRPESITRMSRHAKERHAQEGARFGAPSPGLADFAFNLLSLSVSQEGKSRNCLRLDELYLEMKQAGYKNYRGEDKRPVDSLLNALAGDSRFINIAPRTYAVFTPRIYSLFSEGRGITINKKALAIAILGKAPWNLPPDEIVEQVLFTLPARERAVIRLRFRRHPKTLATIGNILPNNATGKAGVTRELVRQIQANALKRLRHTSRKKKLFSLTRTQLLQDPQWKAAWSKKISQARGGREEVTCVICGTVFEAPRWHHRRVCSTPCLLELRRQNALKNNVSKRAKVRAKISEKAKGRQKTRDNWGRFVAKPLNQRSQTER